MAYSEQDKRRIFTEICKHVSKGQSINKTFKSGVMEINQDTFFDWLGKSKEFSEIYTCACEERATGEFEEMREIAFNIEDCYYIDKDGIKRVDNGMVNLKRIQEDVIKFRVARMHPKKYGDKIQVDNTNSDGSFERQGLLANCSPKALEQIKSIIEQENDIQ